MGQQGQKPIAGDSWDALPDAPANATTASAPASGGGYISGALNTAKDLAIGGGKSLAEAGIGVGGLLRKIPGVNEADAALSPMLGLPQGGIRVNTDASNTTQRVGKIAERVAELLSGEGLLSAPLERGIVNVGLRGGAGNPLIMGAKTLAGMGAGAAAGAGSSALHGDPNLDTSAEIGAAGPAVSAVVTHLLQNPTGSGQILPYLVAILTGKLTSGMGAGEGLASTLGSFGLTRMLARQALRSPNAIPAAQSVITNTGRAINAAQGDAQHGGW